MFKVILILVFLAVMVSLGSSFFFMMKDRGTKNRMVNSLFVRVGLSVLLIVLIVYGYYNGHLSISPNL
ncbi:MAG: twin transmembrane helix small protein [Gammaproteobacteria bacterium]|nr:twin transmembrane helix small protein [Gammaproteobacteria bacterium]